MGIKLDNESSKQKSFLMRNQWIVSVGVIFLFIALLFGGCNAFMNHRQEVTKQNELKKAKKEKIKVEEEQIRANKIEFVDKNPVLTLGTNYSPSNMADKEKLKLYESTEKIAKAQGKTIEQYTQEAIEAHDKKVAENRANSSKPQETKVNLTQDQCDTVKSENEMMKKSINQGKTNSMSESEYKKNQQKLELCKKQGMIE
ncbi:ABC transporter permease [Bacillus bombysepticus]|uniref:ABC transporter permease n=1 Tax=Bacillus cereus TaxID=1396 RepID=UPI000BF47FEA|nr:ABC transporter permease [Bacillus cereus]PEU54098.1 ABC transporter permease [Bacillus cereus]